MLYFLVSDVSRCRHTAGLQSYSLPLPAPSFCLSALEIRRHHPIGATMGQWRYHGAASHQSRLLSRLENPQPFDLGVRGFGHRPRLMNFHGQVR
jgi:hypothetical protein